ncbi:MAG: hypothetical protein CM15mP103_00850 [Gammaproteobacteria bacterium]|nr:MAG: hypothetical protein CM15mP103_00850 [Gammaproteobacteria bacterium]
MIFQTPKNVVARPDPTRPVELEPPGLKKGNGPRHRHPIEIFAGVDAPETFLVNFSNCLKTPTVFWGPFNYAHPQPPGGKENPATGGV